MPNKPVISGHWDLFTRLIRLSDKIGKTLPGSSLYIWHKREYKTWEEYFLRQIGVEQFFHNPKTYYEVITYKGKKYYFRVKIDLSKEPPEEGINIEFTTETFGWAKDDL